MSLARHEQLIQLITFQRAKADGSAGRADHANIWKCGLQPIAKIVPRAQPDQIGRRQRRMRLMPDIEPQLRELIEFSGLGCSDHDRVSFPQFARALSCPGGLSL